MVRSLSSSQEKRLVALKQRMILLVRSWEDVKAEVDRLVQRFHSKDASKSANAKKVERKIWEEKVLQPQRSISRGWLARLSNHSYIKQFCH